MPVIDPENCAFLSDRFVPVLGIGMDTVRFSLKSYIEQQDVQVRLPKLMSVVLGDLGIRFEELPYAMAGDGMNVFLPPGTDLTHALPGLLSGTARRLAEDNARYSDRIQIRMSLAFGMIKRGPNGRGFAGGMITDLTRLVDCVPIRQAMQEHPESDLAVLISSGLFELVDRAGCPPAGFPLNSVEVVMEAKRYSASALLWISPPGQANAA